MELLALAQVHKVDIIVIPERLDMEPCMVPSSEAGALGPKDTICVWWTGENYRGGEVACAVFAAIQSCSSSLRLDGRR